MGLLDDAIKEHLELKRKHGATEEELKRQETEALGPARRDFAAPEREPEPEVEEVAPVEPELAAEPPSWLDEEPEVVAPPEPGPERERVEPVEHAAEAADPTIAQEPLPAPDPTPAAPPPPPERELREAPSPLREEPPAPVERRKSETPTQGFDALSGEDLGEENEEVGEDEDVLEETPEFLQDTPEHDRLWFEQKPPRDFDFDG